MRDLRLPMTSVIFKKWQKCLELNYFQDRGKYALVRVPKNLILHVCDRVCILCGLSVCVDE